jgi:hypothetical protein
MVALGMLGVVVAFVELEGATVCPRPDEVAARLQELVVADGHPPARERVHLDQDGEALVLRLGDDPAHPLAQRRLEAAPCADLANAAAVVIAAWATELRAAATPNVVLPRARPRAQIGWELAGGFVGALAGPSFAAGGELSAMLGQRGGRLHGRLALGGTGLRDIDVGMAPPAHGRYTRAWLGLGPVVRFRPGRFLLDLDALASVALIYVSGIGYTTSRSATDVDVGLGGGGRAAVRAGPVAPYLGLHVQGWLRPLSLAVSGPAGGTAALPRFEVWLSAGLAVGTH